VFKPFLGDEEKEVSANVLDVGWLGMGKNVGQFESQVQQYIEAEDRYVVAVSTGHAALHLGLLLMGVGPGDEVITPSFNNAADFQAILATGAEPVLCDIEEDTLNIDLDKVESLINEQTKAIIVMDYDCILCDHDRINEIALKYNVRILHDAAHSFGSRYKGKKVGSFSDITMFSFDPVKTITCLDGGILVVKTEEEMRKLHEMRLVGMGQPTEVMYQNTRAWTYDMKHLGFRYHMSNMHAAIGTAQLSKINEIEISRREACRFYNQELQGISGVITPKTNFDDIVPFLYYIRVSAEVRDEFRNYLYANGIDTGIHWQPGHWFTLLKEAKRGDLSVTDKIGHEILSLPLHSNMLEDDLNKIVKCIMSFFEAKI
jgi:dTDP-4-amino-4,6-dideoxygalactose transaminase